MNTIRVIINADDCGRTSKVNEKIEECIKAGRLTSTTVMANWNDIAGAKRLYNKYKDIISFGCHITLDEGRPILFSQVLADNNFIEFRNGEWFFTRELWKKNFINGKLKQAILDECCAQIDFLLNQGFQLSHLDSHHHVHTAKGLIWLMPELCKKYNIYKYRRIRNCMHSSFEYYVRQLWNVLTKFQMNGCCTTERFGSYSDIYKKNNLDFLVNTHTLEIMCHPGHPKDNYAKEVEHLLNTESIVKGYDIDLINYNQL